MGNGGVFELFEAGCRGVGDGEWEMGAYSDLSRLVAGGRGMEAVKCGIGGGAGDGWQRNLDAVLRGMLEHLCVEGGAAERIASPHLVRLPRIVQVIGCHRGHVDSLHRR